MGEFGGFFGWTIVVCYGIAVLNYVFKFLNKKFSSTIKKNDIVKKYFNMLLKLIVKYHKIFGSLTILFILVHFLIMYSTIGIKISGLIVATVMLIEIISGMYGTRMKKRTKGWLYSHRIISIIIGVALVVHVVFKL